MLLANGLANMTISPGDVHIREDFDGKYMEFFTYKELPFGLQETQEVAWDHWKGMERATVACTRNRQRCVSPERPVSAWNL